MRRILTPMFMLFVISACTEDSRPVLAPDDPAFAAGAARPPAKGTILFDSDRTGDWEIYSANADGTGLSNLTNHPAVDWGAVLSPNGARIVFVSTRGRPNSAAPAVPIAQPGSIFVMNADGTDVTQLTDGSADDRFPTWSPDGKKIAFERVVAGNIDIIVINADGTGWTQLTDHPALDGGPAWSPDGKTIAFHSGRDNGALDVFVMNADGTGLTNLTQRASWDAHPRWSKDGKRLLFESGRDGNLDVYVMFADGTRLTNLSRHPAEERFPYWSPDGRQIVFRTDRDGQREIHTMNADGTGLTNITRHPSDVFFVSWGK